LSTIVEDSLFEIPENKNTAEGLRERLLLAPQDTGAMWELAILLENSGDLPGAIDLYQRALRADPYRTAFLTELGRLWRELGDIERARSWFDRALSIDPDSAEAATGLASLDAAEGLTEAYVRTLFDQYADRFDADLTGTLKYQAPGLVAALLARCGVVEGSADVLDLGCGTGLSGAALKPFARTMDGVDLSPGMVAKARGRGIYDALAVGEAEAFLAGAARSWDIVAAVDMLNYIGDLEPIFRAAAARLRPGGLFAGTVEKRVEGGQALSEKRRYRHGADHVQVALDAAGLGLLELSEAVLRQEGGVPVVGLVFAARR
jgi:predicted TPR repeat methyltransferase